jgi:alcohol dehydrogenase (NADP+)
MEYFQLNNGRPIPLLGFGTWKSAPNQVKEAVVEAIKVGYRHIDCAHVYGNESEVGDALKECIESGLCQREDLFITSKLWNTMHSPEDVMPALMQTLANLKQEYVDMYLIHWPVATKTFMPSQPSDFIAPDELPIDTTWEAMENCFDSGKAKGIGVSNFSIKKLEDMLAKCRIPPAVCQVERHPYLNQNGLLEYCKGKGIHVTGYSGLGSFDRPITLKAVNEPVLLNDPVIGEIAEEHIATPAQILLNWAIRTGTSTIPKSVKPHRILENFECLSIKLSDENVQAINSMNKNYRYVSGSFWCLPGSPYTLSNLWDE